MALQNAVVALLVQGAVTLCKSPTLDPAKEPQIITLPPPCLAVGVTHWGTILPRSRWRTTTMRDEPKISNFHSSVHKTFLQFSVVRWQCFMAQASLFFLFCHLSNGFLTATRPVKPAVRRLLFTVETETSLLRPGLSCAWSCCPVSCLSHKLLTLRNLSSECVVALDLPDLFLSEFPPVSKCLLMVSESVLTDTLAYFAISLKERPMLLRVTRQPVNPLGSDCDSSW